LRRSGGINAQRFLWVLRVVVRVPFETQVPPFGVERPDQGQLLFAPPGFGLFFSVDGVADVLVVLEVDQPIKVVLTRKTLDGRRPIPRGGISKP
jgi:hypothetical protein